MYVQISSATLRRALHGLRGDRSLDQLSQIQIELALDGSSAARRAPRGAGRTDRACRSASVRSRRCRRSCRACRRATSAMPVRVAGNAIAGEARPVLFLERGADFGVLAVVLRVVLAHQALQLGELADHRVSRSHLLELGGAPRQRLHLPPMDSAMRTASAADALGSCRTASRASPGTSRLQRRRDALRAARVDRCPRRTPRRRDAAARRARCRRAPCPDRGFRYWRR